MSRDGRGRLGSYPPHLGQLLPGQGGEDAANRDLRAGHLGERDFLLMWRDQIGFPDLFP